MATATANDKLVRPQRAINDDDIVCPAGCAARAGRGVMCRIERHVLDVSQEPYSIRDYCLSGYQHGPTWTAEKDAIHAGREQQFTKEVRQSL